MGTITCFHGKMRKKISAMDTLARISAKYDISLYNILISNKKFGFLGLQ